jgi:hypothetical protein
MKRSTVGTPCVAGTIHRSLRWAALSLGLAAAGLMAVSGADAAHGAVTRLPGALTAGEITTVAGGVGGPGLATKMGLAYWPGEYPCATATHSGDLFVTDGASIRKISASTDRLTTPVGTGTLAGALGNGSPATQLSIGEACGIAFDQAGNLIFNTDSQVLVDAASDGTFYGQQMTAGHVYVLAGTTGPGCTGDGGPATSAGLTSPVALAVDSTGNVLIDDSTCARIRVVSASTGAFYGQAMTAGDIYTIAGNGTTGYSGDGGPATGAELRDPGDVALAANGNVLIADSSNFRIRVVAVHTGVFYGQTMTAGHIYSIAGDGSIGNAGNGGPATSAEFGLPGPGSVVADSAGNLLISDSGNNQIRVVAAKTGTYYGVAMKAGDIYSITPASGSGPVVSHPGGVSLDGVGNVVFLNDDSEVYVQAVTTGSFYGQAMIAGGIYRIAGIPLPLKGGFGIPGEGGLATRAMLSEPNSVAVDASDNMLIGDINANRVLVVAAKTGTAYGLQMTAGHLYTIAGGGTERPLNGRPALHTRITPDYITVDQAGNVIFSATFVDRVFVVAEHTGTYYGQVMTAGDIYTLAGDGIGGYSGDGGPAPSAKLDIPQGIAVDAAGNVLIADFGNKRLRVVAASTGTFYGVAMTAGDIYTIAGNGVGECSDKGVAATGAVFDGIDSVTFDTQGNVVVADSTCDTVDVIPITTGTFYEQAMTAGNIYTVAGNGSQVGGSSGVPALSAGFGSLAAVAVDKSGNLVVSDAESNLVQVVAAHSGTYYGQPMTAEYLYTIAGGGTSGLGDLGPGVDAELDTPTGLAVDQAGNVLIADPLESRLRLLAN